jgi:CcmD family protein
MSGVGYLAIGFALVWLLVAGYLVWLGHRQALLDRRLAELEGRAADSDSDSDPESSESPVR